MAVVKVDASNEANFTPRKLIDPGQYVFEIANDPVVEQSKSSDNQIISVELRCLDDGKFKGQPVHDIITLTKKAEFKLCHLALAAGTQTKEEIAADGVDLSLLKGSTVEAKVSIEAGGTGVDGTKYRDKNRIENYLFEAEGN